MTPKAKTLQEKFGFADHELITPKHDEIMLWLDANVEKVLPIIRKSDWDEECVQQCIKATQRVCEKNNPDLYLPHYIVERRAPEVLPDGKPPAWVTSWKPGDWIPEKEKIIRTDLPPVPPKKIVVPVGPLPTKRWVIEKIWEKPIRSGYSTVGFVDLAVNIYADRDDELYLGTESFSWFCRDSYSDHNHGAPVRQRFWIEVKPEIRSLGEVIRQIRMYESYVEDSKTKLYVCCPDDRFKEQLLAQNIGFIKAEL